MNCCFKQGGGRPTHPRILLKQFAPSTAGVARVTGVATQPFFFMISARALKTRIRQHVHRLPPAPPRGREYAVDVSAMAAIVRHRAPPLHDITYGGFQTRCPRRTCPEQGRGSQGFSSRKTGVTGVTGVAGNCQSSFSPRKTGVTGVTGVAGDY